MRREIWQSARCAVAAVVVASCGGEITDELGIGVAVDETHSWNNYHWKSTNLTPDVVDKTTSALWDRVTIPAAVAEWAALTAPINPEMSATTKGPVTVSEAFSVQWLGLAQIWLDSSGHITKGVVKLNTAYLGTYGDFVADHVLCQELGHILGLGHNQTQTDTCMNDCATAATQEEWLACLNAAGSDAPNLHDDEQLNLSYSHTDGGGGGGGGKGSGRQDEVGPITIHEFPIL